MRCSESAAWILTCLGIGSPDRADMAYGQSPFHTCGIGDADNIILGPVPARLIDNWACRVVCRDISGSNKSEFDVSGNSGKRRTVHPKRNYRATANIRLL